MKNIPLILVFASLIMPFLAFSQDANKAIEPAVQGTGAIDLLAGNTFDAWQVPSALWSIKEGIIIGNTKNEKLKRPEWLYTKQQFSDFVFTCELRLTGDDRRNTGVYYRANRIQFKGHGNKRENAPLYEAPSGYEFDAAYYKSGKTNFRGTLGDWYARPKLRIFPDPAIIDQAYKVEDWNRMSIRAHGNRLEYWLNGIKILDFVDKDPKGSREGLIGLQLHDGSLMKAEYRNIRVLPLEL